MVELQLGNGEQVLEPENFYLATTVVPIQTRYICTCRRQSVKEQDIVGRVESQCASPRCICNCKGRQGNFVMEKAGRHHLTQITKDGPAGCSSLISSSVIKYSDLKQRHGGKVYFSLSAHD